MIDSPLISIIVPNYNSGEFVAPFIDSVKKQTYGNWELIFVDDGSSDNSLDIIREFSLNDTRINIYLRDKHLPKGACMCRNIGFELSKGEYVCFFDSDDLLPLDSLENRLKEFEHDQLLDFVVSPAISFRKVPFDIKKLVLGIPLFKDDLAMFLKRYRLPFGVWTNTYKRDFLRNNDIKWDVSLSSLQDSDFNIQCLLKKSNYSFSINPTPVYFWRISGNPNSITKKIKSKKNIDSQIYFYSKLYNIFKDTKYIKQLNRFGLTILLRCAHLNYNGDVSVLASSKCDMLKYKILNRIYKVSILNKMFLLLNPLFFPFRILDEYLFFIRNRIVCVKYFKSLDKNVE